MVDSMSVIKKLEEASVSGRLIAVFVIVWLLFLSIVISEILVMRSHSTEMDKLYSQQMTTLFHAQEAEIDVMFIEKSLQKIILSNDIDKQQLLVSSVSDRAESLREHVSSLNIGGPHPELKLRLLNDVENFNQVLTLVLGSYENTKKSEELLVQHQNESVLSGLNADLTMLAELSRHDADSGFKALQVQSNAYRKLKTTLSIGALLLLSLVSWLVIATIRRPMHHLFEAVRRVSQGKLDEPLPYVNISNEIGRLATSIQLMQGVALEFSTASTLSAKLNKLAKIYQSAADIDELCALNLQMMLEFSGGQIGLLYLAEEQSDRYVLRAKLGNGESASVLTHFRLGEGQLGMCARNNRIELLRDIDALYVRTGSCQIEPAVIALIPISDSAAQTGVLALLEIVSIHELSPDFLELVTRSSPYFFSKLALLKHANAASAMIETLRLQSNELQEQKRTLRQHQFELLEKQVVLGQLNGNLEAARLVAEQSVEVKGQFLANMSHEIRTPMNAIIGMTQLAMRQEANPKQRDYLKKIDVASKGLLVLINDILDFSKIDADRLTLENVPFRLADVILNVTAILSDNAHQKMLEFLIKVDDDVPEFLSGDPTRLGQILINILGNAIKFTEFGEVLMSISCAQRAEGRTQLRITVRDTGIGMTVEQIAQLFKPFVQADATVTRRFGGTGLGLSISKHLIEMMTGEVTVSSEPGLGSTFDFTLWFDATTVSSNVDVSRASLRGKRVLVVDDNRGAREILAALLHKLGMRVELQDSAQHCFVALQEADALDPYEMVFMDWRMPEEDGIFAAKTILHELTLSNVPQLVIVTAASAVEIEAQATAVGVKAILEKPVNQSSVCDVLTSLLSEVSVMPAELMHATPIYAALKGMQVLVAEDNSINQQIVAELLDAVGVRVTLANNGKEALELLLSAVPPIPWAVVLMDVQMPVMDGYEATALIHAQPHLSDLPIIALTAHALSSDYAKSLAAGMQAHLTKPLNPTELYGCLLGFVANAQPHVQPLETCSSSADGSAIVLGDECASFATIRGLDVQAGLHYSGDSTRLYLSILRQFLLYENTDLRIREAMLANDAKTAERLVHTLKGIAANIGADDITAISGAIETALRNGAELQVLEADLISLGSLMHELVSALRASLAVSPPQLAGESPVADKERLSVLCKRLSYLLASNDVEAVTVFDRNRAIFKEFLGDSYEACADDMQSYDLESAYVRFQDVIDEQFEWM
jgi:signal transduction histidine kinase/DNA-binding response OmpR family regulator/HPt (histidine-containing phosphotransfer) domain-containing protein/HAMP domain-containing protein